MKANAAEGLKAAGSESGEAFGKYFRGDCERVARVVQTAGIKPE